MKSIVRLMMLVGMFLGVGSAMADSQYGYDAAGTTGRTAQSNLNVRVEVPNLLLLRVGAQSTISTATITAALTGGVIPNGGVGVAVAPVNGSNAAANWNTAAPTFDNASSAAVPAAAWTNSPGGASVAAAAAGFTTLGIADAQITVAQTQTGAQALPYPGGNLAGGSVNILRNSLAASDWVFSITGAVLNTVAAGTETRLVVFTATAL